MNLDVNSSKSPKGLDLFSMMKKSDAPSPSARFDSEVEETIKNVVPASKNAQVGWHVAKDAGAAKPKLFDIRALCKSEGYKSKDEFNAAVEAHDIAPVLIEEGRLHVPAHLHLHFKDRAIEMHEMDEEGAVQVRTMEPHQYAIEIMSAEHYDRIRNAATLAFDNLSKDLKAQEEKVENEEKNSLANRKLSLSRESLHSTVKDKFPDLEKLKAAKEAADKDKLAALNHENATEEMYAEKYKTEALDKKSEEKKEMWKEEDQSKEIGQQDRYGAIKRKHLDTEK